MNYIGSKLSLLSFIQDSIFNVAGNTHNIFCDLFAGTGIVGRHFKKLGYSVYCTLEDYPNGYSKYKLQKQL